MIYLDNAATTQVSQRVLDAMLPYFTEHYGNAGSIHSMGRDAARAMQKAREQCAKPLNASPNDIIFTSGGSEANTLAIMGLADHLISVGKTHIITSEVEHPSVLECMKSLFHMGFEITYISVDHNGNLCMDELTSAFRKDTGLVSIMTVNNETGNAFPINAIGLLCESHGVLFHTDAVQAYGNINIDMEFCGIDFLSVSGHKFHAPKGVGFLFEIFCQGDNLVQKEEETVVAKKECGTEPVQRQEVFPIDRSIPAEMLMTELSMSFAGKFNREMIFNSIASMVPVGTPVKLDIKCFIVG